MPEIKNTFLGGKMNKDLDERLIPKNEYRDALNVEVSTSQGDDVGSLQNTWGNTVHSNISDVIDGAKCIGALSDREHDKIYWFIKGDNVDAIAEYDLKLREVSPVLVDFGMQDTAIQTMSSTNLNANATSTVTTIKDASSYGALSWTNGSPSPSSEEGTSWVIESGTATAVWGTRGILQMFKDEVNFIEGYEYEIEYDVTVIDDEQSAKLMLYHHGLNDEDVELDIQSSGTKKIQWIQGSNTSKSDVLCLIHNSLSATASAFSIDNVRVRQVARFLNFEDVDYITGINILDGMLLWTDGHNEPKKINIERCKAGSYGVADFGSTSFVGPELITNGSFTGNSDGWTNSSGSALPWGGWKYNSNNVIAENVPDGKAIHDRAATIINGKTYKVSITISSWTSGKMKIALIDNLYNRTLPLNPITHTSGNGTYTWTITAGSETDAYIVKTGYTAYAGGMYIISRENLNCTIDDVSVKEVAFDWNRTTKVKDSTGRYIRNIKEEDITLIKKYPLNAPKMELINTTKPKGSVIKTSCTTPMNTTYNHSRMFADGSGDMLQYWNFVHTYLVNDVILYDNVPQAASGSGGSSNYQNTPIQLQVGGPDFWDNITSSTAGTSVQYPLYVDENKPYSTLREDGNNPIVLNKFTQDPDYHKRAWKTWCGISEFYHSHVWCISDAGNHVAFSSGVHQIDKIGGRIWMMTRHSEHSNFKNKNFWKKGQRVVLGYWSWNNNYSFWTYKDGSGETLVKPPGTSSTAKILPDGTKLRDEYGGSGLDSPTVFDPQEKYDSQPSDFGSGWTASGGQYIGASATTSADTFNTNGNLAPLDSSIGRQYIHDIAEGIRSKNHYISIKITVITNPLGHSVPVGVASLDAATNTPNGLSRHLSSGSPGTYYLTYHRTPRPTTTGDWATTGLTIFKQNGVECIVEAIQVDLTISNPVQIQPLVFSPKPDYEVGDLVKLTNANKTPSGDDITVTVKLLEEIAEGNRLYGKNWRHKSASSEFVNSTNTAMYAPESWEDGISYGSNMIGDSDFQDTGSVTASVADKNGAAPSGADWYTSLEMIINGNFSDGTTGWTSNNVTVPTSGTNKWHITGNTIKHTASGNWISFEQRACDNPRIVWETGGSYRVGATVSDYIEAFTAPSNSASPGINFVLQQSKSNGDSGVREMRKISDAGSGVLFDITFTPDGLSASQAASDRWTEINPRFRIYNQGANNKNYQVTSATIDDISVKANGDVHRVTWGTSSQCEVVTGSTSQIIAYPSNSNGTKAGGGTFTLTSKNYYKIEYEIQDSNHDSHGENTSGAKGCTMRLLDHDKWGTFSKDLYLDTSNGVHSAIWKQQRNANQLQIALGPAFAGKLKNVKVYPVTVTSVDYGENGSNDTRKVFDCEIVTIDNRLTQLPPEQHKYWTCELLDEEPIFKRVFPRFAYRWKYEDGEYSTMSAFTEVAFLPDANYKYDANDGYNLSMQNTVRRVILSGFENKPHGVSEIDILYKESDSNNIYSLTTIKGSELDDFSKYEITKEKFHAVIDSKQILRPYDNVPRKALAQELSANRLIFGNYTQQYDISPSDEPIVDANVVSQQLIASKEVAKSVKAIREYQVGMSYLDTFGRQSPVFSTDGALISVDQKNASQANSIQASLNNFPPDWVTHYKYFVKDAAASYYNISLDRFYQAENSDHVWLSFVSSDWNKLNEDDYLVLKKQHNSDSPVQTERTIKYKVLAKQANAPEFIKVIRKSVGGRIFNTDGKGLHFYSQSSYGGSADGYPQVDKLTFRLKGSVVHSNTAFTEAVTDDQTGRYIRIGQEVAGKPSMFSKYYEILHISRASLNDMDFSDDEDYYEFTLVQPLEFDASFIGSSYSSTRKLFIEYYREELNEFDNTFEGKFFVKIAKDGDFDRFVGSKQKIEDSGYNITNAQDSHWAFAYENSATVNTRADRGKDTDVWLRDKNNFNWSVSEIDSGYDASDVSGKYNGVDVAYFPALMDDTVDIDNTSRTNPYIGTWSGTVHADDWGKKVNGEVPQRFSIFQAFTWNWPETLKGFTGMNTSTTEARVGQGFIVGNNYCSFAFTGIGEINLGVSGQPGGGTSDDEVSAYSYDADGNLNMDNEADINTWWDINEREESAQWFNNFKLLQQLTKEGTQFRWNGDPSDTVYTVKKVHQSHPCILFDRLLPDGNFYGVNSTGDKFLNKDKENYGYRIDLELDKNIVWSPTSTITSGLGFNTDGTHTPLTPFSSASAGTTAQIQILEKRPSESTYTSFNPAVFEIEQKERADLNLYYETPDAGMVIKNNMYIEALNSAAANDGVGAIGTPYKPSIQTTSPSAASASIYTAALPYSRVVDTELITNGEFLTDSGFSLSTTSNFSKTYDSSANTYTINKTDAATSDHPYFQNDDWINLTDGEMYQLVVDVESMDNDEDNFGGAPDSTKVYLINNENSQGYRPLVGRNPDLVIGRNVFDFTHNKTYSATNTQYSASTTSDTTRVKLRIELTDTDNDYSKEITINEVSLRRLTIDETKPVVTISTGEQFDWCTNPNQLMIDDTKWNTDPENTESYSRGYDLPAGITLRISERDQNGSVSYYKDYTLPNPVSVPTTSLPDIITLPPQTLKWHNCFSFGNGVESNRMRDDFNAVQIDRGPRVSTTLEETYKEETKGSGLIFSGIYNSTSSVNNLNQFIQAESITKDLNPEYGTIQKLFSRNTNILALCENKILKVLADKDALFNADGSMQVTSTNKVLGQAIPFVGEYGISRNPESFANFGYRVYFTDRDRGAILRLSADGLTSISEKDMISYFKTKLPNSNTLLGTYDENRDTYNLTLDDTTVSFSEAVNGWTSFKSFLPESGLSLNGEYYTWKNGDIWKHHSNALRNNFYNTQYETTVKFLFNDLTDEIKNFNTLNYEGTDSRVYEDTEGQENQIITNGWYADYIKTDLEEGEVVIFKDKEGKWFNNITGVSKTEENLDIKDFTSQGLGILSGLSTGTHPAYKTLVIKAILPDSIPDVDAVGTGSGSNYNDGSGSVMVLPYPTSTTIAYAEDVGLNSTTAWEVQSPTQVMFGLHTNAGTADEPWSWIMTGVIKNLKNGNRYYVEADVEDLVHNDRNVGFSNLNMTNRSGERSRTTDGKIYQTFTYKEGEVPGIHLFKANQQSGVIKNISCINITPKIDDITYTVNTSATDRTETTTELKTNIQVGAIAQTVIKYFYIHSQTVNGIKYAVAASEFNITSSSSEVVVTSSEDLGSGTTAAGYYGNVIKVTITVTYSSASPFPDNNVESYINIEGVPTLAIDQ